MRKQLDISTQQAVLVYGLLGPRLSCVVDQLSSGGVKLSVEAWYPEWWGGPSGMGVLKQYTCDFGDELVFRLGVSSVLPFARVVRITPVAAAEERLILRLRLPLGWSIEVEDLPPEEGADVPGGPSR